MATINKIRKRKNITENWVEKTMLARFKKPIYFTIFFVFLILSYTAYTEYSEVSLLTNKHNEVLEKIKRNKIQLTKLNDIIEKQNISITNTRNMILDDKQPLLFLTKVCDLLKNKEIIGSYYISKKLSKKFNNVIIFDIKIAYGDKNMLKTIANMILDKLFYVKTIKVTKTGVQCELYKPIKQAK